MSGSIRDTFFEECEDLLDALVEGLSAMSAGTHDDETVHAVFRAVHSIKGGAGAFGLDDLVNFAHRFETVLDRVRSDELPIEPDLMRVLQRAGDHLTDIVEANRLDAEYDREASATLLAELNRFLGIEETAAEASPPEEEFVFEALTIELDTPPVEEVAKTYRLTFRPARGLYANGHEPILLFEALAQLGTLDVTANLTALGDFDQLDWEAPAFDWTLTLQTSEPEHVIHEVFEFVEGLCDLHIGPVDDLPPTMAPEPDPVASVAEVVPKAVSEERKPVDKSAPAGPKPTLRVDLDRVDRLINTVGELIINQAVISQRIEEMGLPSGSGLSTELEDYKLLAREIQEGVMAIRAQPVKPLFQRMSRIVREAAEATGKTARLVTEGEGTEVDKTVVERLADPLTHMIRNAIDHGLESPESRKTAGKDATGTIRLAAFHRSGSVLIEVSDDGAGLNRERIFETAVSKGLIPPDADLAPAEIDDLLFMPGFSTAAEVSALSGRGVGMDVVKTAIHSLGGRVTISTVQGEGTTFSIVLPLTLAVMDGMVVNVAGQTMVVPIASIVETIRPGPGDLHRFGVGGWLLSIRGSYVPIVDVASSLGQTSALAEVNDQVLLLIQTERAQHCALAVDGISDQRQVVIKSLEGNYGNIPGVSAATILGDGKIALIIDPDTVAASGNAVHRRLTETWQEKDVANG
ncbi:chemotaxis protein CheA [Pelagovum pacificum]|uniref:Chemotaxis protein CheA n=1 Tax=Pelagovum pacificum TaxID=2588711 RepID=A0A5C5G7L7_9RHOB|nr:chemotaxis protein CheA [Pelagovum pacificum]QQA41893.1 chemotaxis protein CheA [Pelagovum pacificum]TNY30666.1 chemotaxis protein CheA [Pelagovum pacificum]